MTKRALGPAAVVVALVVGIVAFWHARRAEGNARVDAPRSTYSIAAARDLDFPVFDAGPATSGLPRVAVLRRNDGRADYVSFVYGDCRAVDHLGCAPPAEVQVWPSCARNLSMYETPFAPTFERIRLRGVPGATFEGGRRLELETGTSTVVVFGRTRELALEVAGALRGLNVPVGPMDPLPQPAARRCGS